MGTMCEHCGEDHPLLTVVDARESSVDDRTYYCDWVCLKLWALKQQRNPETAVEEDDDDDE